MEARVSLITLGVADLERSLRFYRDGLGLPTTWSTDKGVIFFQTAGTCLALYPYEKLAEDVSAEFQVPKTKFAGITLAHNVHTRDEVDQLLARAAAAGAQDRKAGRTRFGVGTADIFRIPTATCGKSPGGRFPLAIDGSLEIP